MPEGTFTGWIWIEADVRLERCCWRKQVAAREPRREHTQVERWRLRAGSILDIKEQVIVVVLGAEERAIAPRRP
jgi:hypothetical protein